MKYAIITILSYNNLFEKSNSTFNNTFNNTYSSCECL